jgi:hypothetical protein
MDANRKTAFDKIPVMFMDNFGLGRKASIVTRIIVILRTHIHFVRS